MEKSKLLISAIFKFLLGFVFMAGLLFFSAGSLKFWKGWLFLGLLFVPMLALGFFLFVKSPELLEKRLDLKEKEKNQKTVVGLSGLLFLASFLIAGFDFRFGWSRIPLWVLILSSIILLISYTLYAEVMRENAFLSRTVKVQENQKIVDSGLYSIVRHPMYAVTIWLFLAIPIVLGSWWSLLCMAFYPFLMIVRILNEEKFLADELEGYKAYMKKVKWRLIPFIW